MTASFSLLLSLIVTVVLAVWFDCSMGTWTAKCIFFGTKRCMLCCGSTRFLSLHIQWYICPIHIVEDKWGNSFFS